MEHQVVIIVENFAQVDVGETDVHEEGVAAIEPEFIIFSERLWRFNDTGCGDAVRISNQDGHIASKTVLKDVGRFCQQFFGWLLLSSPCQCGKISAAKQRRVIFDQFRQDWNHIA